MEHNFLNPLEEITFLFDKINLAHQTLPPKLSLETLEDSPQEELQPDDIVELMEQVSLQDQIEEEPPTPANRLTPPKLIQAPRRINDYSKLLWTLPRQASTNQLMKKRFPKEDNHLKSLTGLIAHTELPLRFVDIYPHSQNLVATMPIPKETTLFEISQEWLITHQFASSQSLISHYLTALLDATQKGEKIYTLSVLNLPERLTEEIKKIQHCQLTIYIFEKTYIQEILNTHFTNNTRETFEWLYFQLLPKDLNYHPLKNWKNIKHYHPHLGTTLQHMEFNYIEQYKRIKQLLDGEHIQPQFSFQTYLLSKLPTEGISIYHKYHRQFTPKHYLLSKLLTKTRQLQFHQELEPHPFEYQEPYLSRKQTALIPILDLFHHSSIRHNLEWEYNRQRRSIVVRTTQHVNCGDLLYIKYRDLFIQNCFTDYGFADATEPKWCNVKIMLDFSLVGWLAEIVFCKRLTAQFREFLQEESERDELAIEIRVFEPDINLYEDQIYFKDEIIQDTIENYKEYTLNIVEKHRLVTKRNPQKNTAKTNKQIRRSIISLIIISMYRNIEERKQKIQALERIIENTHPTQNFNSLHEHKSLQTILLCESNLLKKIVRLFQLNEA